MVKWESFHQVADLDNFGMQPAHRAAGCERADEYIGMGIPLAHPDPITQQGAKVERGRRINAKHADLFSFLYQQADQAIDQGAFTGTGRAGYADGFCGRGGQGLQQFAIAVKFIFHQRNTTCQRFDIAILYFLQVLLPHKFCA